MVLLGMTQQSRSLNDGLTLSSHSVMINVYVSIFQEYNQNQKQFYVKMAEVVADEF